MRSHHPVEPNHIFPVDVVKRHVALLRFTQGIDVFPGSPGATRGILREGAALACLSVAHLPHDVDLTDDRAHELCEEMNNSKTCRKGFLSLSSISVSLPRDVAGAQLYIDDNSAILPTM